MHGHHATEDEPMAEMNLIPLIDIALTLLIILMVTSVFIHHPGVSMRLPQSATREGTPETPKDLTIVIAVDGSFHVDGKPVTPADLQQRTQELAARDRESRVLVKGDRDVPYARVMDVIDIVRQAGLTHIVLPTDPKAAQSAPLPGAPNGIPGAPAGTPDSTNGATNGASGVTNGIPGATGATTGSTGDTTGAPGASNGAPGASNGAPGATSDTSGATAGAPGVTGGAPGVTGGAPGANGGAPANDKGAPPPQNR
jgi:biopolymer transport protein TolR